MSAQTMSVRARMREGRHFVPRQQAAQRGDKSIKRQHAQVG
jgi:hypothetical protein